MAEYPLRVLHITEGFDGGVITFMREVLPAQRAQGVVVSLVCSPRNNASQTDMEVLHRAGVDVQCINMRRGISPWTDTTALVALVRVLRRQRYDLVHTHCFKAGVLGRLAARMVGAGAVVHTPHCWPFMRNRSRAAGRLCRLVERELEQWADALMLVSPSQLHAARSAGIGAHAQCVVIPNGLTIGPRPHDNRDDLRHEIGLEPSAMVVGTVCRLVAYKCVEHFIQAAQQVQRCLPNIVFVVIGDGPERERLRRLSRSLHLENAIRFLGHRSDAGRLMRTLDVCVLCSKAEGLPYTILEAMSGGAAVVASNVPGNADMLTDGRSGLLYEWGCIDHLSKSIHRCLADAALRTRLTRHAQEHISAYHNVDERVAEMVDMYRRLLAPLPQARCSHECSC